MRVPNADSNDVNPASTMDMLEEVFTHHRHDLLGFCYRRLGSIDLAEDACGRIMLKALGNIESFTPHPDRPGATLRAWLFQIARNDLVDFQRTRRFTRSLDQISDHGERLHDPPDPAQGPEAIAVRNETDAHVRLMLSKLPDSQRAIVELRLAGLRGEEIAQTLGLTLSAVKSAQYRAYQRLRELLADLRPDVR